MSVLSNAMVGRGSSGGATGVERSLRFRGSSALSLTPGAAGNRKILSKRFCVKRSKLGALQVIASAGTANIDRFYFDSSDRLCLDVLGTARLVTTSVYRDPTEWLIVGFDLDVGNGTAGSRAKIIVGTAEATSYGTDGRASITNTDTNWNDTVVQYYGRDNAGNYLYGYLTQVASVDGSNTITYASLDANNILNPISTPTTTWGTNGHLLTFRDVGAVANLGYDTSGNGKNFDSSTFSLTGVTYDSMYDYPVNAVSGTQPVGNYATLNPLKGFGGLLANGNLAVTNGSSAYVQTIAIPKSGKWFAEFYSPGNTTSSQALIAFRPYSYSFSAIGDVNATNSSYYRNDGSLLNSGGVVASYSAWSTGSHTIVAAFDMDAKTVRFYLDGTAQGTGAYSLPVTTEDYACFPGNNVSGQTLYANYGQQPVASSTSTLLAGALSGFKSLCTANLPSDAVVTSGSFTGNAASDGPVVYLKGNPTALTINGNAVTFGTHADKLATGFKLRTSSASYNASGTNTFTATAGDKFANNNRAQGNP